jgi:hypothetical protein
MMLTRVGRWCRILDEIVTGPRRSILFVVNHSAGKDSMRMLGKVREIYPDLGDDLRHADTGFEQKAQYDGQSTSGIPVLTPDDARQLLACRP